jgi:hypothetical protein
MNRPYNATLSEISTQLRVCLDRRKEKWEDRECWEDLYIYIYIYIFYLCWEDIKCLYFPSCVFGWKDEKVEGYKI